MADYTHEIATLNGLAVTMADSIHGYRKAAANDVVGLFKDFFLEHAAERQSVLEELRSAVMQLGGTPGTADSSMLGRVHSRWLGLKSVILAHDVRAIIKEVKWGEHHLIEKLEAALDDESLSGPARLAVQKAYQSVRKSHEEVSRIREVE